MARDAVIDRGCAGERVSRTDALRGAQRGRILGEEQSAGDRRRGGRGFAVAVRKSGRSLTYLTAGLVVVEPQTFLAGPVFGL
jgi:hypothetical protein